MEDALGDDWDQDGLMFINVLRIGKKEIAGTALVKKSARLSWVATKGISRSPDSTHSRT